MTRGPALLKSVVRIALVALIGATLLLVFLEKQLIYYPAAGLDVTPEALGLPFEEALHRLRGSGLPALPVLDSTGRIAGLLTMDNITDLILVRQAVRR